MEHQIIHQIWLILQNLVFILSWRWQVKYSYLYISNWSKNFNYWRQEIKIGLWPTCYAIMWSVQCFILNSFNSLLECLLHSDNHIITANIHRVPVSPFYHMQTIFTSHSVGRISCDICFIFYIKLETYLVRIKKPPEHCSHRCGSCCSHRP